MPSNTSHIPYDYEIHIGTANEKYSNVLLLIPILPNDPRRDHIFDSYVSVPMFEIPYIILHIYQIQMTSILRQLLPFGIDLGWRCSIIPLKLFTRRVI